MGKLNDNEKEIMVQLIKYGYTQKKVADLLDVSQSTICREYNQQQQMQIGKELQLLPPQQEPKQTICPVRIVENPYCPIRFF